MPLLKRKRPPTEAEITEAGYQDFFDNIAPGTIKFLPIITSVGTPTAAHGRSGSIRQPVRNREFCVIWENGMG